MAISWVVYTFGNFTEALYADILPAINDGAGTIYGADYLIGYWKEKEQWIAEQSCSNSVPIPVPDPPIYPKPFSSDLIYSREHFSAALKMIRGDTYSRQFVVIQDGQFYNLTGATVRMTFKWSLGDSDGNAVKILTSAVGGGIVINDAKGGVFTFTLNPSDTSGMPPKRVDLYYDAQVTDNLGNVYTVAYGKLAILPDSSITSP